MRTWFVRGALPLLLLTAVAAGGAPVCDAGAGEDGVVYALDFRSGGRR